MNSTRRQCPYQYPGAARDEAGTHAFHEWERWEGINSDERDSVVGDTQACCIRVNFLYVEGAQGDGSSMHPPDPTALRFIKSSQRRSPRSKTDPRPARVAGIVTHISALAADIALCVLDYHNDILDQLINCSCFRSGAMRRRLAITLNMRERTLQRWGKAHKRAYPIKASPLPLHGLSTDGTRPATPGNSSGIPVLTRFKIRGPPRSRCGQERDRQ
jgi:hypothetical protein